ncbi:DNA-directed RNA polymerase subunit beta [Salimicrobium halophilum]|uniref:DNA-directed RNA polymerase subunit beta n=1 Tax=Salimicrobium halophilum TaxID=86666 RepID=A0A1G8SFL8_9BACI|nr:DNA-directed RNA polymerase subunit beta [Salimicrobium halophilum]SDJ28056.1 DNA-directed RNA polymerase subunit beta [Salimicrobium halophilum]
MATDSKNKTTKKKPSEAKEEKATTRKEKHKRRALPIWLRVLLVLFFSLLALAIGLMIGYSVLGSGDPLDVFDWSIWQHIIDIMTGAEQS